MRLISLICTITRKHASEITLYMIGSSINTMLFDSILEVFVSQSTQALGLMDCVTPVGSQLLNKIEEE